MNRNKKLSYFFQYVEELQLEVLKHRHTEETKQQSESQPPPPYNEFIAGNSFQALPLSFIQPEKIVI